MLITALFNFMTRLADGLGVDFPADRLREMQRWFSDDVKSVDWVMTPKE